MAVAVDRQITLHKLEVLCLVVEAGGVGRAADLLFVTQPVVSAHLRALEQRLDSRLFYRKGRRLELTESGRVVHEWAKELLTRTRELERHLEAARDGSGGAVTMGASMTVGSYILPGTLARFRAARPRAQLRLAITDTEHALDDTRSGELDFAVVVIDEAEKPPDLESRRIGQDELVLVAAPDGVPDTDIVQPHDLRTLPFVDVPAGLVRRTSVERELEKVGIGERNVVLQLGHPEAMKRAVGDGLGVTLLFRSAVARELELGLLREVTVEGLQVEIPIHLVARRGKTFSALHLDLIARIEGELGG
jgi:LysR family transcriptional regulator, low CO2-responsive transcriptional regulator